jgi:4-hydroxy-4-methyl-2-oxoglutarate aldolase
VNDAASVNDELLALGTATLGESGAHVVASGIAAVWPGAALAGPAYTAMCSEADNLPIHAAVAAAPAGSIVCAGFDQPAERGYWGEVLTVAARARALRGLVIDGCVRDADAIERLAFPVFARGLALRGATKNRVGTIGDAADVGGITVSTGDIVVADRDGVVAIDIDSLEPVLAAARRRAEHEQQLFVALRNGATTVDLLTLDPSIVRGAAGRA